MNDGSSIITKDYYPKTNSITGTQEELLILAYRYSFSKWLGQQITDIWRKSCK